MLPRVFGVVRDRESGLPLSGLTVRAFDHDLFREQLLGTATTGDDGAYEIRYRPEALTGPILRFEKAPDLFIEVVTPDGTTVGSSRERRIEDASSSARIDLDVEPFAAAEPASPWTMVAGQPVDLDAAARLTRGDLVATYAVFRGHLSSFPALPIAQRAFPRLLDPARRPACGLPLVLPLRKLLRDRGGSDEDLAPFDGFPAGAVVERHLTERVAVLYTTDPRFPYHAVDMVFPEGQEIFSLAGGQAIGTLAPITSPETGRPVPTYVQRVALLAEHTLTRLLSEDLQVRDPRTGPRLLIHIRDLRGAYGQTDAAWDHLEIAPGLGDAQLSMTVPHEVFHRSQLRYHRRLDGEGLFELSVLEGGARLFEDVIVDRPNRYAESAMELLRDPSRGITLIPSGEGNAYATGLFWKYLVEQHAGDSPAEPPASFEAYRAVLEAIATAEPGDPGKGAVAAALRDACAALSPPRSFDLFTTAAPHGAEALVPAAVFDEEETVWGNFLLAIYLHGRAGNTDPRFRFAEDGEAVEWTGSRVATVAEARVVVPPADDVSLHPGQRHVRSSARQHPYSARYFRARFDAASRPRAVQVTFDASPPTAADPLLQIVVRGEDGQLLDLRRSDEARSEMVVDVRGASEILIVVGSRERGFSFQLRIAGAGRPDGD